MSRWHNSSFQLCNLTDWSTEAQRVCWKPCCPYLWKVYTALALFWLVLVLAAGRLSRDHPPPLPKKLPDEPPSSQETGGEGGRERVGRKQRQRERESSHYFSLIVHEWPSWFPPLQPGTVPHYRQPPQFSQEKLMKRPWKASSDRGQADWTN